MSETVSFDCACIFSLGYQTIGQWYARALVLELCISTVPVLLLWLPTGAALVLVARQEEKRPPQSGGLSTVWHWYNTLPVRNIFGERRHHGNVSVAIEVLAQDFARLQQQRPHRQSLLETYLMRNTCKLCNYHLIKPPRALITPVNCSGTLGSNCARNVNRVISRHFESSYVTDLFP